MCAVRRVYVRQGINGNLDERYSVQIARDGKPVPGIESDRITAFEEVVMDWRKANHIHGWFVDAVQDGIDNCRDYYVPWDTLERLHAVCEEVIKDSKLVEGMVYCGERWSKEKDCWVTLREPGKLIEDSTAAQKLLPTRTGFFFGSTEYDETYLEDVVETRDWSARMLAAHKAGVPGEIFYSSSW